ncbi:MAG: hypothetical protein ACRDQ5_16110 [Sciscionella sp.]
MVLPDAFNELTAEPKRADARFVVVPALHHLAMSVILQNSMLNHLEREARHCA